MPATVRRRSNPRDIPSEPARRRERRHLVIRLGMKRASPGKASLREGDGYAVQPPACSRRTLPIGCPRYCLFLSGVASRDRAIRRCAGTHRSSIGASGSRTRLYLPGVVGPTGELEHPPLQADPKALIHPRWQVECDRAASNVQQLEGLLLRWRPGDRKRRFIIKKRAGLSHFEAEARTGGTCDVGKG